MVLYTVVKNTYIIIYMSGTLRHNYINDTIRVCGVLSTVKRHLYDRLYVWYGLTHLRRLAPYIIRSNSITSKWIEL